MADRPWTRFWRVSKLLDLRSFRQAAERAVRASLIKLKRKIPYVDAFGVELAAESPDRILVTADFDLKPATKDIKIEFLPTK